MATFAFVAGLVALRAATPASHEQPLAVGA
jgi:hypothetical protein